MGSEIAARAVEEEVAAANDRPINCDGHLREAAAEYVRCRRCSLSATRTGAPSADGVSAHDRKAPDAKAGRKYLLEMFCWIHGSVRTLQLLASQALRDHGQRI